MGGRAAGPSKRRPLAGSSTTRAGAPLARDEAQRVGRVQTGQHAGDQEAQRVGGVDLHGAHARRRLAAEPADDPVPVAARDQQQEEADHVEREQAQVQQQGEADVQPGHQDHRQPAGHPPAKRVQHQQRPQRLDHQGAVGHHLGDGQASGGGAASSPAS